MNQKWITKAEAKKYGYNEINSLTFENKFYVIRIDDQIVCVFESFFFLQIRTRYGVP